MKPHKQREALQLAEQHNAAEQPFQVEVTSLKMPRFSAFMKKKLYYCRYASN